MRLPKNWRATRHEIRRHEITVSSVSSDGSNVRIIMRVDSHAPSGSTSDDVSGDELLLILRGQLNAAQRRLDMFADAKLASIDEEFADYLAQAQAKVAAETEKYARTLSERSRKRLEEAKENVDRVLKGEDLMMVYEAKASQADVHVAYTLAQSKYHADTVLLAQAFIDSQTKKESNG